MTGATGHDANLVGTDADQAVTAALMPVRSSADDEFWTAKWDAAKTQEVAA